MSPSERRAPRLFSRRRLPVPSKVYDTYWRFAAERQAIFFRRLSHSSTSLTGRAPDRRAYTTDPILAHYKFTNAYRASDRTSQYLIRHIIYAEEYPDEQTPTELFFRILLFKIFNRIDTWERLTAALGPLTHASYSFERYDRVLSQALADRIPIFSAAYIMPSGRRQFGEAKKHRSFLRLLETMLADQAPLRIQTARAQQEVFHLLRGYPLLGDFLAYQYAIDLNYSTLTNFSEMDFVRPGPGASSGIHKCFRSPGDYTEVDIIRMMAERQEAEFARLGLDFRSLWGRPLQLVDCQNLFCEVDKYSRIAHPQVAGLTGRTQIKQHFRPTHSPIVYWYPPKWGLNPRLNKQA